MQVPQIKNFQVLMVPGLHGSGPEHWQSRWEREHPAYLRVVQDDWANPQLDAWAGRLDRAIRDAGQSVLIVAHSFGCLAAVRRGGLDQQGIAGALLVAPANPEKFAVAAKLPSEPLAFPSIVVASENDPWMPFDLAQAWAGCWGSRLVNLGAAGHVNAESGFGLWPEGRRLLEELAVAGARHIPRGKRNSAARPDLVAVAAGAPW